MSDTRALVPIAEIKELANSVAASGFFPAFKNPQQALVLMMMAQVEGCHPMQAVQRYDVIQGKPAKKADAMLADFQQRGGTVTWTEYTDEAVEAEFMAKGMAKPCRVRWTYQQAIDAGLTGKPTWKQFKRQMLKARVISEGVRISDPGVVAGLYTPEEVQDFDAGPARRTAAAFDPTAQPPPIDAEVVPPPSEPPAPKASPAPDDKIKAAKVRALVVAIKAGGIPEAERKHWMGMQLGRTIESSKDLAIAELDVLMAKAAELKPRQPGEDG